MASPGKVRRRAWSCARCRRRKIKCDGLSPTCSKCAAAGSTCIGLDSVTKQSAPRSVMRYLESAIAEYEKSNPQEFQIGHSPALHSEPLETISALSPPPLVSRNCQMSPFPLFDVVTSDFSPSFLGLSDKVPLARFVVTGTRIPSTRRSYGPTDIDDRHPRSIVHPQSTPATPLHSIPVNIADYLLDNYLSRILPPYPIFYGPDVVAMFNSVFHCSTPAFRVGARASPYAIYVISLIMAISLTTAARTKQARANNIALGLFKEAVQQISGVLTNDIQGLQALLLLLQYTFLNPSVANLWFLSGYASQACIDMGLHQELPKARLIDPLEVDMRRRLFWCTYEMDVAVSAGLLRPMSLPNKYINVPFSETLEDSAITPRGVDGNGRRSKFMSTRIWVFRQIECEINSVLFQNEPLPSYYSSVEEWMNSVEVNIHEWNQEVHRSRSQNDDATMDAQWAEMSLYADIAYAYILVTLFRPCPRIKAPTPENLMKGFVAAVKVAGGYWEQSNQEWGNIKYVFHPCHHSFSSATVFLLALQHCKPMISASYTLQEVEGFMETFSRFFATIAERWPAATRCLEEYERLLAPVKKEYVDYTLATTRLIQLELPNSQYPVGMDVPPMDSAANLDDMLYFSSLFDQPSYDGIEEYLGPFPAIPADWDEEFDFRMPGTF